MSDKEYTTVTLLEEEKSSTRNRFMEISEKIKYLIIALIVISVLNIVLLIIFIDMYSMTKNYSTGAIKMEEDYKKLKERVDNLEVNDQLYQYNKNQLEEMEGLN